MRKFVFASCVLAPGASASVLQQPLGTDIRAPLDELQKAVGDALFYPSPVAMPCYQNEPGCSTVRSNVTVDTWISEQPGGFFYANWGSCQTGDLNCPMPLNNEPIPSGSRCYQGSVPTMMIKVRNVSDIQAGYRFARQTRMPLVIKNTGHDWKGRSTGVGTLAFWMHHLRSPAIPITLNRNFSLSCRSLTETVIHMGPGETWGGAYHFANENNLAVVGGTCGTVGVGGWIHGGGHSPLSTKYGMGADNLRQVQILTPDVRGGGGGTFGVVTNITYHAIPPFQVQEFSANFAANISQSDIQEFFNIVTSNATTWSERGWGGYMKPNAKDGAGAIELIRPGPDLDSARADMATLINFLDRTPGCTWINKTHDSWFDYFQENLEPAPAHRGGMSGTVASRLINGTSFEGSARTDFVNALTSLWTKSLNLWLMLVTPRAFPHTTASALHPTWATAVWSVRIHAGWDQFRYPTAEYSYSRVQAVHEAIQPIQALTPGMGASISESDIWQDDPEATFWGAENSELLQNIKHQIDPDNILSTYAAVNWNPSDARYRCYPKKP